MTILYSKQIISLQCYAEIDGESDVVFTINWYLLGNESIYSSSKLCVTKVPFIAGQSFTPYAELTESQVFSWINEYTTTELLDSYKKIIEDNIEQQKIVTTRPLPWQTSLS